MLEYGDKLRDNQQRLDPVRHVSKAQVSSTVSHRCKTADEHAEPARVHELDFREIDYNVQLAGVFQLMQCVMEFGTIRSTHHIAFERQNDGVILFFDIVIHWPRVQFGEILQLLSSGCALTELHRRGGGNVYG